MNREDFIQHYVLARAAVISTCIDMVPLLDDAEKAFMFSQDEQQEHGPKCSCPRVGCGVIAEKAAERYGDKRGPWEKMATQGLEML